MKNENNTQHTPGPWRISEKSNLRIDNSKGEIICALLYATTEGQITPETEANARLIASAPDLLNDLRGICNYASQKEFNGTVLIELISGAMQTVLKAEGKNLNV